MGIIHRYLMVADAMCKSAHHYFSIRWWHQQRHSHQTSMITEFDCQTLITLVIFPLFFVEIFRCFSILGTDWLNPNHFHSHFIFFLPLCSLFTLIFHFFQLKLISCYNKGHITGFYPVIGICTLHFTHFSVKDEK